MPFLCARRSRGKIRIFFIKDLVKVLSAPTSFDEFA